MNTLMTRYFKVAGHVFSLTMTETCSLWPRLTQYDPFITEQAGSPLFDVRLSQEPFERPGSLELLYDPQTEPGETVVRLSHGDNLWVFDMSPDKDIPCYSHLVATEDFSCGTLYLDNRRVSDAVFGINNSLMLLFAFRTAPLGTLELHASMVSNSGKAFLFLARSGTGKSTHSQLWLDYIPGSELMNDDNPIVRVLSDGTVMAYGSPWSGKTPCYRNVQAPVGAFVRIRRSPQNLITRLSLLESYALLYSSCSGFKAHRDIADGLHATLEKAVTTTPCYVLDCRPDEEAAKVCSAEVLK
ncbi:MAG: hypothetical protein J6S62_01425 [Bacteroidales bacterium]|nr:hypothetical protein [Bacteroidales bacterium]